ncbi:MAG: hypothetical protein GKS00_17155 [Alphaproteobacteria bacterium]|nr:hypothetical protein [Alphaproteobacteria bacterium]
MDITVTAITAGLLALTLIVLSVNVIRLRGQNKVSLGDGGNEALQRAIRGQANCAEYAPIGVLLLLVAELQSANFYLLIVLGAALLIGRLMHGYAFGFTSGNIPLRRGGMMLTFIAIVSLAVVDVAMPMIGWLS